MISRQTFTAFTDIMKLHCDLREHRNPIFSQDTPGYDAVLTEQVW